MTAAPPVPAVYGALSAVMADVQNISKDQRVTEGPARFSFRGVDDVVNVVGPVLRKHKVIVVPHEVQSVEHERYQTKSGALMDGITIRILWRFYAEDGSFIEAASAGQSSDSGDKAIPKAHSVAYRTVLLQALCIPTDEPDPDQTVHERAQAEPLADLEVRSRVDQAIRALPDVQKAQLRQAWEDQKLPQPGRLTDTQAAVADSLLMAVTEQTTEVPA